MTSLPQASFPALGTTATLLVTEPSGFEPARAVLEAELQAIDLACSRFRPDSELMALNRAGGRPVPVSALFLEATEAALRAAELTDGLVDPTVGRCLEMIGYDRDFADMASSGPALRVALAAVPGWRRVRIDGARARVTVPAGVQLDFGATAKALCADRAAAAGAAVSGCGVLVSLGGDIAVAGPPPPGGWAVRISHHHGDPADTGGPVVAVRSGGLATSSTTVRRWERGGQMMHHLIDPSTGAPATDHWCTVSVAAGTCLDANIASCAAIILGPAAVRWLEIRGLPARLVGPHDHVVKTPGWPAGEPESTA